MRYWLYKCNLSGGPAGYWGDWRTMVFAKKRVRDWGGHYSTRSAEVALRLDDDLAVGDVVVAYQTNERSVIGFCRVEGVPGPTGNRRIDLAPIEYLDPPFTIHDQKAGTVLEASSAVNGMVMLRELDRQEMETILTLSGSPRRVLRGQASGGGYKPPKVPPL